MLSKCLKLIRHSRLPTFLPGNRNLFLLRSGLFAAVTGILLFGQIQSGGVAVGWMVLAAFVLSHIFLSWNSQFLNRSNHLKLLLILADTFLLVFTLTVSNLATPRLFLSFFLMILVISLGKTTLKIFLGSGVVILVCFFGSFGWNPYWDSLGGIPHPILIPFFVLASLYYGYTAAETRRKEAWADQAHREREEFRSLLKILKATTSTLDFPTILRSITSHMAEVLRANRVSIVLKGIEGSECMVLVTSDDKSINRLPIQLSKYPEIQRALETGAPVIINDIEVNPLVADVREDLRRLGFHSLLVVPICYGEEILGTLCLRACRAQEEFATDEIHFTQMVASAVANVLKNSFHHHRVQERADHFQTKAEEIRRLFHQLPQLIFVVDMEGKISDFNRTASQLTGFSSQEIIGRDLRDLWPAGDRISRLKEKLAKRESWEVGEVQLCRQNGSRIEVSLTLAPFGDQGEPFQGIIAIAEDLGKEKRIRSELDHTERLSSIGKVVATVAHELRNHLGGLLGFSQLLVIKNTHPEQTRDLERISACAQNCKKVVNDLLGFSHKSDLKRNVLGVNGILVKTLDLLENQMKTSHIQIMREFDPRLPLCNLDFQQIQQVFLNILGNAQQAISSNEKGGVIWVRTRQKGDDVIVELQDNGPGMESEVLEKIFDPFFTTKPTGKGTGLGLSLTHGIVRDHNGRIEVESEAGQGTLFRIYLPITRETRNELLQRKNSLVSASGHRILIVDDDSMILDLCVEIFWGMGHRVDTASNGMEALRKIQGNDYDLIISDLKMPKMDGIELFNRIREIKAHMTQRFIFATGDVTYMNSHEFMEFSGVPCLLKPIDIEDMHQMVDKILSQ